MLALVLIGGLIGLFIIARVAFWRVPIGYGWRRPVTRRVWGRRVRPFSRPLLGPRPWRRGGRRW